MKLVSLKNKSDFDLVFKEQNLIISSDFFKAYILFQSIKEINYGFIYPKKYIKLAVDRNYAKRVAKEMLKTIQSKKGFKIVFLVGMKIDTFEKPKMGFRIVTDKPLYRVKFDARNKVKKIRKQRSTNILKFRNYYPRF